MPFRILFLGTSDFAVPSLKALAADGRFEIAGVVTQPDKPVGRHAELTPPPVKLAALSLNIEPILQPEKLKDETFRAWIEDIGRTCDLFVVASYGKIFPQRFLDLPKNGVVNVHGSLLPRWRGASPINAAIAAGDAMSGVTIMKTELAMDAGPILAAFETQILPNDTAGTLHDRIAMLGAIHLPDTLTGYLEGRIIPQPQNEADATTCGILTRDSGKIDWSAPAPDIDRLVRAYDPWPGTWTTIDGKRLKILESNPVTDRSENSHATPFILDGNRPCVSCGEGTALELKKVQIEGKESMSGKEFLKGRRDWEGAKLTWDRSPKKA
jgi:methionyl-tRNA formyltransferase